MCNKKNNCSVIEHAWIPNRTSLILIVIQSKNMICKFLYNDRRSPIICSPEGALGFRLGFHTWVNTWVEALGMLDVIKESWTKLGMLFIWELWNQRTVVQDIERQMLEMRVLMDSNSDWNSVPKPVRTVHFSVSGVQMVMPNLPCVRVGE